MSKVNIRAALSGALSLLMLVSGCSLISFEQVDEPLTPAEVNARIANHAYLTRFARDVAAAADSIINSNEDPAVQLDAIRWKLHTISEARRASFHESPYAAMIDTWAFTLQMRSFFHEGNGRDIFGPGTSLAAAVSDSLELQVSDLVRLFSGEDRYEQLRIFVEQYAAAHPLEDLTFSRTPSDADLRVYLGIPDSAAVRTIGSLPQVVDNYGSQIGILGEQIPNEVLWGTQLFVAENADDLAKLDSLAAYADRIASLVDRSPELLREAVEELKTGLDPILGELDRQRQAAMQELRRERIEITESIHRERELFMKDLHATTTQVVNDSWGHLRSTVDTLLFWFALILAILLGVPFALGYIVGRTLQGRRQRKQTG